MGPLIFKFFINDNVEVNSLFELIMYANDTTIVSTLDTFGNRNISKHIEKKYIHKYQN